jgi:hypothetical protein
MTIVLMVGLNLVVLIGMGLYFNRRIDRKMKPDQLIEQLREEVNGVIAELNQATDRNVTVVEDRLDALQKTIAKADRAVKVLQREAERREESTWRYNDIVKRGAGSVGGHSDAERTEGKKTYAESIDRSHTAGVDRKAGTEGSGPQASPSGAAGPPPEAESPRGEATSGEPETPGRTAGLDASTHRESSDEVRSGGSNPNNRHESTAAQAEGGATTPAAGGGRFESPGDAATPSKPQSKKDRILDLHRKGIAPNIIAGRVGSTIGEVELVISLSERTNEDGLHSRY